MLCLVREAQMQATVRLADLYSTAHPVKAWSKVGYSGWSEGFGNALLGRKLAARGFLLLRDSRLLCYCSLPCPVDACRSGMTAAAKQTRTAAPRKEQTAAMHVTRSGLDNRLPFVVVQHAERTLGRGTSAVSMHHSATCTTSES